VAIVGEPGIGKSRLAAELAESFVRRGGRVVVGHCYETGRILPFGPWLDGLRSARVPHDAELLRALPPVWRAELARLLPEIGADGPGGPADPARLFEAVAQLLQRLVASGPLLLLLEDVQWADEMSLRLVAFLGHRLSAWPLLFVVTVREEDGATDALYRQVERELERARLLVHVRLAALSRSETTALVEQLTPSGDSARLASLHEQIWRATEGHPLMVVETMRALPTSGLPVELPEVPLPERIRALIAGRVDRLGEQTRQLMNVAALIGRQFGFALLQRASDLSEDAAADGVEELVRHRLLRSAGDRFEFTHERIREVVMGRLLAPRRALLHRRIGEALEALHAQDLERYALALGTHYREGGVWAKAVGFLRQAGFQAAARASTRDAVACYEHALDALAHLPDGRSVLEQGSDLRFSLAHARYVLGEFEPAIENYRAAEALSRRLGDDRRSGHVLAGMSYLLDTTGQHEDAVQTGERALAIGTSIDDRPLQVWTRLSLGRGYFAMGQYRRASEQMRQAMDAIEGMPLDERFGRASILASVATRTWLALCLARMGDFAEARALGEEAVRIADVVGGPAESVAAHYALGHVHLGWAHFAEAVAVYERALPLCGAGYIPIYAPRFLASLGSAYAQSNRIDEGLRLLDQAVELARSRQLGYGQPLILVQRAEALVAAGRAADARRTALQALELSRRRRARGEEAWTLHTLAEVAHLDGEDGDAATQYYRDALVLAEELEMRPLQARCHFGLGAAWPRTGRCEEGRAHLCRALDQFRSLEMTDWSRRAEALLARAT
jgi:tetratricopeptide (TPR) repeat protein